MIRSELRPLILVVDDREDARFFLARVFEDNHRVLVAENGKEALDMVHAFLPDLILLDLVMPGMDGFEVCRRIKADPVTRLIPVVAITGLTSVEDRVLALEAGADDFISKPFHVAEVEARVRNLVRLNRAVDELEEGANVLYALNRTLEAKDKYTEGHSERVSHYCVMLGQACGLDVADVDLLRRGGLLHDLGKVGIPDAILNKPGRLDRDEFELMKTHTTVGWEICHRFRSLQFCLPMIRSHHERLDGTGYPDGLKGDAIPLVARIAAIADIFDALSTHRSYKAAWSYPRCQEVLFEECRRGWWDRELVELFFKTLEAAHAIPQVTTAVEADLHWEMRGEVPAAET